MKRNLIFLLGLAGVCAAASADVWSYADCVDYARQHNISLQKTRLNEQTADISLSEAQAQWQPSLDFSTSHGYSNYPWGTGARNSYTSNYGFNAAWTVWDGGQRENTIRRDKLGVQMSRLNTDAALRSLQTDILQVYLNILYARESIDIYEEMARLSKAQADRTKALMEAGKASRVDYAQLRSQAEQDNYALVNARGTFNARCLELKQYLSLGIEQEVTPAPVDWTADEILAALPPLDESYDLALATDVELRSLGLARESSEVDEKIARSGRMPKIALSAGVGTGYVAPGNSFGTSMKQNFGEQIGLSLSVPIFDNKKTSAAVGKARVLSVGAQLDINQRRVDLARQVENWYIDTRTSQSRYTAAVEQLDAATASDALINEKFQLGYVDPIELMTAHNALTEARHTVLQAKYMAILGLKMIEYYRTAAITLN
ncbi:MAG: TolC family protein [Duncaniella sp.]|nr:TolC family protein [Duncaniella sp.]